MPPALFVLKCHQDQSIRTTTQAFHALGFFWARRCASAENKGHLEDEIPSFDAPPAEKDRKWRIWAAREIRQRALLGHYVLDGLICRMVGELPSAGHAANHLGLPSSEAVFEARTPDEWLTCIRSQTTMHGSFRNILRSLFQPAEPTSTIRHQFSAFSLRVVMEGIQSLVSDFDSNDEPQLGAPDKAQLRTALAYIYENISVHSNLTNSEKLEILLRWHTICLDICKDTSKLCEGVCSRYGITQRICGSGDIDNATHSANIMGWVHTEDARRALLHAIAIQEIVETLPRGRAHVIHIPSSLFASATIYCVFCLGTLTTVNIPSNIEWRLLLSGTSNSTLLPGQPDSINENETIRYLRGEYTRALGIHGTAKNLLYELNSLQKLFRCLCSQWGIAFDMEDVMDQWIALCH